MKLQNMKHSSHTDKKTTLYVAYDCKKMNAQKFSTIYLTVALIFAS